jgi:integrase
MNVGSVRERGKDRWELRWRDGARRLHTATVSAKSERDARKQMATLAAAPQANAPAKMTCAAWFSQWLDIARGEVRPVTWEKYEQVTRLYLSPALGAIKVRDLSPAAIQTAFATWVTGGRHRGPGGLAKSSLGLLRKVLHASLQRAVELEVLHRNPMEPLRRRLPNGRAPEVKVMDAAATIELLERVDHPTYAPAVWLAAGCGLRRGEIIALRWRSIDFAGGRITIAESTTPLARGVTTGKTKSGRTRTITAPAFVIDRLKQHRLALAEQMLALGLRLGPDQHVLLQANGEPANPVSLTHWCKVTFGKLHSLRHGHASQLLNAGVNIKAVSARLGHNSATMTLSTYAHLLPGADEDAADKIDALLSGSKAVATGA